MKKTLTTLSIAASTVAVALAQQTVNQTGVAVAGTLQTGPITALLVFVSNILGMLAPILVSLAVLAFFWYLVLFIWKGGESSEKKTEAVKGMVYAILALFLMVSIWGIIALIGTTFGIGQGGSGIVPTVPVLRNN